MTMKVEKTTYAHIRALAIKNEGIVFMGCGGSKEKWITDVTTDLEKEKIIPKSSKPEDIWENTVYHFKAPDNMTRDELLFLWKNGAKIDMGKMAIWRIRLGFARWLSDYTQSEPNDDDE